MKYSCNVIRKVGDIFTDLGKYVLTAVPIAYFVASAHEITWDILAIIAISGILLCLAGVSLINTADKMEEHERKQNGKQHKIKLQKNTIIVVEEI